MKRAQSRNTIRKGFTPMPVSEVFSIRFNKEGVTKRINEMGFNIATSYTKLEISQMVEVAFNEFVALKKIHT